MFVERLRAIALDTSKAFDKVWHAGFKFLSLGHMVFPVMLST